MFCLICCEDKSQLVQSQCQCAYCYECLLEWIKSQENEICMGCNVQQTWDNIFIGTKFEQTYQEIMCRKYLLKQKDVLPCPQMNCNYFGIIPQEGCQDLVSCENCAYTWNLNGNQMSLEGIKTLITKFYYTKECPQCGISIQKNGGCPSMRCLSCLYVFCWKCNISQQKHNEAWCTYLVNLRIILGIYMFLNIMYQMRLIQQCLSIFNIVAWFIGISISGICTIILPCLLFYCIYICCQSFTLKQLKQLTHHVIYCVLVLIGIAMKFTFDEITDMTLSDSLEIGIVETVVFGISLHQYLKRN